MIRHVNDPEHPLTLEQLKVVSVRWSLASSCIRCFSLAAPLSWSGSCFFGLVVFTHFSSQRQFYKTHGMFTTRNPSALKAGDGSLGFVVDTFFSAGVVPGSCFFSPISLLVLSRVVWTLCCDSGPARRKTPRGPRLVQGAHEPYVFE